MIKPTVIALSGPTGCGKSTVATELAHKLGIVRIISTDVVREVMRTVIPQAIAPHLHKSSFELSTVESFLEQARLVSTGINGIIKRAKDECLSIIIEGVHIVPGLTLLDETIQHFMLYLPDESMHVDYLTTRTDETKGARPVERYLAHMDRIREIQDHLMREAHDHGTLLIDNSSMEETVAEIQGMIDHGCESE